MTISFKKKITKGGLRQAQARYRSSIGHEDSVERQ